MNLAPIILFVYNRPWHTRKTLEALQGNALASESDLVIFADGAKGSGDREAVEDVRALVREVDGFKSVTLVERETNRGLAESVLSGVSDVIRRFGRAIVLEDDLVVSRGFLRYMNEALERYRDAEQVLQISGHVFPFEPVLSKNDAFFLPLSTSWGWATWQRAWNPFDPEVKNIDHLRKSFKLRKAFDLDGAYPYARMLEAQLRGEVDSWAIRWWWYFFNAGGLCLFPKCSLVKNIGFDPSGTHTKTENVFCNDLSWAGYREVSSLPRDVDIDQESFCRLKKYLKERVNQSRFLAIKTFLSKIVRGRGCRD